MIQQQQMILPPRQDWTEILAERISAMPDSFWWGALGASVLLAWLWLKLRRAGDE